MLLRRAMAQAVSRRLLTVDGRVRALTGHVGFVVDKVMLGQASLRVLAFHLSKSFHNGSSYSHYHMGYEQQARLWQQFRDIFSPIDNGNMT
jgi:hypothetical protein